MPQNKVSARHQANKPQQVGHARLAIQEHYHEGPLPPPAILQQYDTVVPGAAERIIAMAEGEVAHRRSIEVQQVNTDIQTQTRHVEIEHDRIKGIFNSDALGQKLGAVVSCLALLTAAMTAGLGVVFSITSPAYWAIPIACVSLPVMGMVQAITGKRKSQPMVKDANG